MTREAARIYDAEKARTRAVLPAKRPRPATRPETKTSSPALDLRRSPATVLVFFTAAARAGVISADFREGTPDWEIEGHFVCTVAVPAYPGHGADRLWLARTHRRICGGCSGGMFAQQKLRQGGEEVLEGLQVRCAAEEVVQDLVLNIGHEFDKHVVGLRLVFDQRILLRITPEIDTFPERIHRVKMLLPKPIDGVQNNVTLQAFDRACFLVTRFPLVSVFDPADQECRVFVQGTSLELSALFR